MIAFEIPIHKNFRCSGELRQRINVRQYMIPFAFKTRVHTNNKQQSAFNRWAGARRYAFNYALRLCNEFREQNDGKLQLSKINDFDKRFNAGKYVEGYIRQTKGAPFTGTGEHEWFRDIPASIGQTAIKSDLKDAWKRHFTGQSRPPKFQGRTRRKSFYLSNIELRHSQIRDGVIHLPKGLGTARLGDIPKWFYDCKLMGTTFSCTAGKWAVSFTLEIPEEVYYRKVSNKEASVGVDIGVVKYAALSNGEDHYSPDELKRLQKRSKAIQRKISANDRQRVLSVVSKCSSCCNKGIKGYQDNKKFCHGCRDNLKDLSARKQKLLASLQRVKAKMTQVRNNMSHQLSTNLVKRFDRIAIEDLTAASMTKSTKDTTEEPGKQIKQKAGLNKTLLSVAPYKFRTFLEYKANRYGSQVVIVPPKDTSRACSQCGHTEAANRKTQADFVCQECGYIKNADTKAAVNIEAKGNAPS